MSVLYDRIEEDFKNALRNHRKAEARTLRLIKSEIQYGTVEKRGALTDEEIVNILERMVKKRRDAVKLYEQGGREDRIQDELDEIKIIESYLPPPLSPEEFAPFIDQAIQETRARGAKDLGKVMGNLMKRLQGQRFDKNTLRAQVEKKLSTL